MPLSTLAITVTMCFPTALHPGSVTASTVRRSRHRPHLWASRCAVAGFPDSLVERYLPTLDDALASERSRDYTCQLAHRPPWAAAQPWPISGQCPVTRKNGIPPWHAPPPQTDPYTDANMQPPAKDTRCWTRSRGACRETTRFHSRSQPPGPCGGGSISLTAPLWSS